jgi:hypothetical protein
VRNLHIEWDESKGEFDFSEFEQLLIDKNEVRKTQDKELDKAIKLLTPDDKKQITEKARLEKLVAPLKSELTLLEDSQSKIKTKTDLTKELSDLNLQSEDIERKENQVKLRQKVSGLQEILETRDTASTTMDDQLSEIDEDYSEMTALEVKEQIKLLTKTLPVLAKKVDEASKAEEELGEIDEAIDEAFDFEQSIKSLPGLTTKLAASEKRLISAKKALKEYRA